MDRLARRLLSAHRWPVRCASAGANSAPIGLGQTYDPTPLELTSSADGTYIGTENVAGNITVSGRIDGMVIASWQILLGVPRLVVLRR